MAGDDESPDDDGVAVEPEGGLKADADRERNHQLDIATAETEVGGFEAHGDVAAFLADFDLDLRGVARMLAAIGFGYSAIRGLGVGRIHGSAPGARFKGKPLPTFDFDFQRREITRVFSALPQGTFTKWRTAGTFIRPPLIVWHVVDQTRPRDPTP